MPDRPEWLVIRRESNGRLNYSLSNAAPDSTPEQLAWMKCQRYFIERANQDAKSELGWDEFQAQKYRAWEHELALTVLASWFVAETKLDWARQFERDPGLVREFEVEVLPRLSTANVREMPRAIRLRRAAAPTDARAGNRSRRRAPRQLSAPPPSARAPSRRARPTATAPILVGMPPWPVPSSRLEWARSLGRQLDFSVAALLGGRLGSRCPAPSSRQPCLRLLRLTQPGIPCTYFPTVAARKTGPG